jgi:hypothetical protein
MEKSKNNPFDWNFLTVTVHSDVAVEGFKAFQICCDIENWIGRAPKKVYPTSRSAVLNVRFLLT